MKLDTKSPGNRGYKMMGVGKASRSTWWGGGRDESVSECIRSAGYMGASQDAFFL